jgi:glycosyltransferase involved in cell wall biosynthesis
VIYPPVDIGKQVKVQKKNIILSVGRFFGYLKEKKHQMMIETFAKLVESGKVKGWDLYLAGFLLRRWNVNLTSPTKPRGVSLNSFASPWLKNPTSSKAT